ncbi:MAG: SUMF1/EgtB/PvdO family nonheme iron enzyme [Anaerolineales bacterium]|nr:SUMF1/EgtB/PvdO family nonheme iron enzyme [Anaerolineales bacterium]
MGNTSLSAVLRGQTRSHHRVLRGGAFNNNQNNVRCAARNRNNPNNRNNNNGFRLVVATFFGQNYPAATASGSRRRDKWRSLFPAAP